MTKEEIWDMHDGCNDACIHYRDDTDKECAGCIGVAASGERENAIDKYETEDTVNRPSHYTQGGIECIEAMEAAFGKEELMHYCKIAAFKYLWRTELKGGIEDIEKAIWYLQKYVELGERQNDGT